MMLSISELSRLTKFDRRTISHRLEPLEPQIDGKAHKYPSEHALQLLYGGDDQHLDVGQERAKYHKAQTALTELRRSELERTLVPATEVLEEWTRIAGTVRAKLLTLPSKLAPALMGQEDHGAIHKMVQSEVYEVLEELGNTDQADRRADDG